MALRKMTPKVEAAINGVREARRVLILTKEEAQIRIERQVAAEIGVAERHLALAVRAARNAGASISAIGREGLSTKDNPTVHRWLEKTAPSAPTTLPVFEWESFQDGLVRVNYPFFVTTFTEADDYPTVLAGVVKRDGNARNGWTVVEDEGTQHTEHGDLEGWLTVELRDVPNTQEGSLTFELEAWVEAHS